MQTKARTYGIQRARVTPELEGKWDGGAWRDVPALNIDQFHERGSDHRPVTRAKAVYDERGIYVLFDVMDRYVRCVHTEFQQMVCLDSCVEFFVQPAGAKGYLNFEFNCAGTMLVYHVIDPERTATGLKHAEPLTRQQVEGVKIWHTLTGPIKSELTHPTPWRLEVMIPAQVFAAIGASMGTWSGQTWRANFYKCGDNTSHPHWAAWNDVSPDLNFHQPVKFGDVLFGQ